MTSDPAGPPDAKGRPDVVGPGPSRDEVEGAQQDRGPVMRRCARCGHPTRADRMVKGFGRDCAVRLGLIGTSVDVGQTGPDLFDAADEDDACDGWDR